MVEMTPIEATILQGEVYEVIRTVYDPEIPVNILDLGLIYDVDVSADGSVHIQMTLTSPACPAAQSLPGEVEMKTRAIPGVTDLTLELVWDPAWHIDLMSDEAKLELGML